MNGYYCREYSIVSATNYGMLPCPVCVDTEAAESALTAAEEEAEESTAVETEPAESEVLESEPAETEDTTTGDDGSMTWVAWYAGTIGVIVLLIGIIALLKEAYQSKLNRSIKAAVDTEHEKMLQSQADLSKRYKSLIIEHTELRSRFSILEAKNQQFLNQNAQLQQDKESVLLSLDKGKGYVATTKGGTVYHRPYCPQVKGKHIRWISVKDAQEEHLTPCKSCNPLQITFKDIL